MYSMVKFQNGDLSIIKSKDVEKFLNRTCILNINGAKKTAFLVSKSDDKLKLLDLKLRKEKELHNESKSENSNFKVSSNIDTSSSPTSSFNKTFCSHNSISPINSTSFSSIQITVKDKSGEEQPYNGTRTGIYLESSNNTNTLSLKSFSDLNSTPLSPINKEAEGKRNEQDSRIESVSENRNLKPLYTGPSSTSSLNEKFRLRKPLSPIKSTSSSSINNVSIDKSHVEQQCSQGKFGTNFKSSNNNDTSSKSLFNKTFSLHDSFSALNSTPLSPICIPSKNKLNDENSLNLSSLQNKINDICDNNSKSTNYLHLSSEQGNVSSFSEYIPDCSDISKDNLENNSKCSAGNNDTVNEIQEPLDVNKVLIPYSKSETKKHFCTYCKKLQTKLSRHLFLKHKNELEVQKAFAFPKNSKERLQVMDSIRKKGDFEHNTSEKYNTGILIVSRQQQAKYKNNVDDYVCCKKCKGFYSKKTIRIHKTRCGTSKGVRTNQIDSRRLTQYIHPAANKILKTKIFPVLRGDEVVKSIRYDELVIKYGNYMAEKYSLIHLHDMIRAKLRLLGRFKIEMRKLDPTISELKQIYKPELFDKCIQAVRNVANWNDNLAWFETPAVATALTSLIKKCGKRQRLEFIKEKRDDLKDELEKFILLWEEESPLLNKKALEDLNNQKRNKKIVLPTRNDINKLYTYLREKILESIKSLSQEFSVFSWTQLVQATLISIQIFNRRRSGEIERLSIESFKNKESITDNMDKDTFKNISKDSLKFAKQFVRITLRGKLGRTVSVLLSPMCLHAIEIILKYRSQAGISEKNPYIFARPRTSKLSKEYFRACPLLKIYANECGAKIPESLRGTTLRKHIATHTSLLNVEEASVERLANFMGHSKDIHKNIYRLPVPVAEITCVSKLLMAAVGGDDDEDEDDGDEDDGDEDVLSDVEEGDEDITENDNNTGKMVAQDESAHCSSSSIKNRRSRSPTGKTRRCRWRSPEKEAISEIFGDIRSLKKLPSLKECASAVRRSPALCKRTAEQVKSWIDNQRRQKTG